MPGFLPSLPSLKLSGDGAAPRAATLRSGPRSAPPPSQVVADDPQREPVDRPFLPDAPDEHLVAAGCFPRRGSLAHANSRRSLERLTRLRRRQRLFRLDPPPASGRRGRAPGRTSRSNALRSSRIFRSRAQLRLLVGLVALELPVHDDVASAGAWARSCSIRSTPAPDADSYVAMRTLRNPAASAMAPARKRAERWSSSGSPRSLHRVARSPFTSGTTSGTPSASRNADDLSTETAPPWTAAGTSSLLGPVPTEKKQRSSSPAPSASTRRLLDPDLAVPVGGTGRAGGTGPRRRTREPGRSPRLGEAWEGDLPHGSPRRRRRHVGSVLMRSQSLRACSSLNARAEGRDRLPRPARGDEQRDLDRRRGHDLRLDPKLVEGGERLCGDARVALHPCADDADLTEIAARDHSRPAPRARLPSRTRSAAEKTISGPV